jgi:hypothetical protein
MKNYYEFNTKPTNTLRADKMSEGQIGKISSYIYGISYIGMPVMKIDSNRLLLLNFGYSWIGNTLENIFVELLKEGESLTLSPQSDS